MKDIADQEVIDLEDMDIEAFNAFATDHGWSDGMPLYVPTAPTRPCRRARSFRPCRHWLPTLSWQAASPSTFRS